MQEKLYYLFCARHCLTMEDKPMNYTHMVPNLTVPTAW